MAEINSATSNTIVGYFESHSKAESAIRALKDAGFQANEVGLAAHSAGKLSDASTTSHASQTEDGPDFWTKVRNFFDGNTAEPYAEEKTKGEFATREITTSDSQLNYDSKSSYEPNYASSGTGSSSTSDDESGYGSEDLYGSLDSLSVTPEHSRYFGDKLRNGGALVTVSAGGRREEAVEILEEHGADLGANAGSNSSASQWEQPAGRSGSDSEWEKPSVASENRPLTDTAPRGEYPADTAQRNIQLYGEVLRAQKERISRGEVRLRKEVHTETQTIEVPVTREELVLERVAVDGKQPAAGANFGENSEIRIPLSEERAYIEKQPVVVEEVKVGKREVSNVESFNEQVRREELKVEDESKAS